MGVQKGASLCGRSATCTNTCTRETALQANFCTMLSSICWGICITFHSWYLLNYAVGVSGDIQWQFQDKSWLAFRYLTNREPDKQANKHTDKSCTDAGCKLQTPLNLKHQLRGPFSSTCRTGNISGQKVDSLQISNISLLGRDLTGLLPWASFVPLLTTYCALNAVSAWQRQGHAQTVASIS